MSQTELARLVAYVFKTGGRRRISEEDWVRILSFERGWLTPSRAKRLAATARNLGLLRNAGERDFEIGLEAEGLDLPLDYRPDAQVLERNAAEPAPQANLPLFRRVVQAISRRLGTTDADVVARINAIQSGFGGLLSAEVAALYYGALNGVDVAPFYAEAEGCLSPLSYAQK